MGGGPASAPAPSEPQVADPQAAAAAAAATAIEEGASEEVAASAAAEATVPFRRMSRLEKSLAGVGFDRRSEAEMIATHSTGFVTPNESVAGQHRQSAFAKPLPTSKPWPPPKAPAPAKSKRFSFL